MALWGWSGELGGRAEGWMVPGSALCRLIHWLREGMLVQPGNGLQKKVGEGTLPMVEEEWELGRCIGLCW